MIGKSLRDCDSPMRCATARRERSRVPLSEPLTSLNPVDSVGNLLTEVLRVHKSQSRREAKKGVIELMERVRIPEPTRRA